MYTKNELNLLFKDFFNTTNENFSSTFDNSVKYPVDIFESHDMLYINIVALQVHKNDINISIDDGVLRVKYEKNPHNHDESVEWHHRGITRKAFNFGWLVSDKFDLNKLTAKLEDGLLQIQIPVSETKKLNKKIEIQ